MSNLLKAKAIFAFATVLAMFATSSFAQSASNALPFSSGVMKSISAEDTISMLADLEIAGEVRGDGIDQPFVVATTPGGAQFFIRLISCDDPVSLAGCASIVVNTAFSNAGATYDELNAFNGISSVTTAINSASDQLLIFGRHIVIYGGMTRDNIELVIALFLNDMQTFAENRNASVTSVSMIPDGGPKRSKIDGLTVNHGLRSKSVLVSEDLVAETGAAVVNLWSADFATAASKALVD